MKNNNGDFDFAIRNLISSLSDAAEYSSKEQANVRLFAYKLLCNWDRDRGNDWYTRPHEVGSK